MKLKPNPYMKKANLKKALIKIDNLPNSDFGSVDLDSKWIGLPSFKVKKISTIRLCVKNVAQSGKWYKDFFGTAPVEELKDFVSFKIGNILLGISLADNKNPISKGGSISYWTVDDLAKAIKRGTELGAKIYRGPMRVEQIQRTIVQLEDPFGNVIGLESDR